MKCDALVDRDHGAGWPVHQIDGEQQVLAGRLQHRDVAVQPGEDGGERLERRGHRHDERRIAPGLRDTLQPDVTLFAQPVERLAPEHDPVLCRRLGESRLDVAGNHDAIVSPASRWRSAASDDADTALPSQRKFDSCRGIYQPEPQVVRTCAT